MTHFLKGCLHLLLQLHLPLPLPLLLPILVVVQPKNKKTGTRITDSHV